MEETNEITNELIFKKLIAIRDNLIEDLRRTENDLKKVNHAIEFFQPNISKASVNNPETDASLSVDENDYSEDFSALQQLHFALRRLGSATAPEITDCIYGLDKRWTKDKLNKRLMDIASLEYRRGTLSGYKSNGRYIYSLKEQQ